MSMGHIPVTIAYRWFSMSARRAAVNARQPASTMIAIIFIYATSHPAAPPPFSGMNPTLAAYSGQFEAASRLVRTSMLPRCRREGLASVVPRASGETISRSANAGDRRTVGLAAADHAYREPRRLSASQLAKRRRERRSRPPSDTAARWLLAGLPFHA